MKTEMVTLPISLVEKMLAASKSFIQFSDELEDFLLSQDRRFIAKMRAARAAHLAGKTQPIEVIERKVIARAKSRKQTSRNSRQ
ncbi:MAG: hypothetical protein AB1817_06210 [Chloroflexota bacterium]